MKIDRLKEITNKLIKEKFIVEKKDWGVNFIKEFNNNKIFKISYIEFYDELTLCLENKNTDNIISSKYTKLSKITDIDFIFLVNRIKMFYRLFEELFI